MEKQLEIVQYSLNVKGVEMFTQIFGQYLE